MRLSPEQILPSQNFLKPGTIKYILDCYKAKRLDGLPPDPIIRKDEVGNMIAIDGHNLIAVKLHRNELVDVHLAHHPEDGLTPSSDANIKRNQDLKVKFETVLQDRASVRAEGVCTFRDLIERYPDIFT